MFDFGLINQEGEDVPYEDAEELLDLMIDWAEKRGYGIGGGFRASSEDFEPFEIRHGEL